jgi:phosphatidylserine/phosphatidylglycerophosphate/cardiolipin synthase-like enzyme
MTFELLATGTEFVNKGFKGTKPEIERLVKNARETIHILIYAFGPEAEGLWDMLADTLERGKHVTIVVNEFSKLNNNKWDDEIIKKRLQELNDKFGGSNFVLADFEKPDRGYLHAKVMVADREKMIIGSANLSAGGQKNNYEMGVLIEGSEAWKVADVIEQIAQNKELCTIVPPSK